MLDSDPPTAGDKLLRFFDTDPVIAAEKLQRCRQKLVRRFAAERCHDPEDLANETLLRVLAALNKNPQRLTTDIEHFISGFARNVILENRRSPSHREDPLENISPANEPRTGPLDDLLIVFSEQEDLLRCLECCLDQLNPQDRNTLIRYYTSEPGDKAKVVRRKLASSLGLTSAQLRKHAFQLRVRLEAFAKLCLDQKGPAKNKTEKLS